MYRDDLKQHHKKAIELQCGIITDLFPEPEVIYDIGPAKIGTEAWVLREKWNKCNIIGFEPCEYRFINIFSSYPGELYNYAISDIDGTVDGYMGEGKSVHGNDFVLTHRQDELQYYSKCKMRSKTLDSINKECGYKSIFVWADIEGSELRMLKGCKELLSKGYIVGLSLELSNYKEIKYWCTKDEVIGFLSEFSYTPVYVNMCGDHGDYIFAKGDI